MGEIIQIHVGQAGVQIANACWELYCLEHGIKADGTLCECPSDYTFTNFFDFKTSNKVVPRAILVDSEPTVIDQVRTGPYGHLYSPCSLITGKEDSGSNFARGYYTMGSELIDITMEAVRNLAESCSNLRGFLIFRSIGGGTGSGLGNLIAEQLLDRYEKVAKMEFIIFPSPSLSPLIVEPYNALLATHLGMDSIECSCILDNEALYDICSKKLNIKAPKYKNLNRIIGQTASNFTTSQRFSGSSNVSFSEFQTNLVPYPRIHFPVVSYAPFIPGTGSGYTRLSTEQITTACFEPSNQLVRCNPVEGKYMTSVLLYRGNVSTSDINSSIMRLRATEAIRFVDWAPTGFKVGTNTEPPFSIPGGGLGNTNKSLVVLSNNTVIRKTWCRLIDKYDRLYRRRAFIHHYIAEGLEEASLAEASEDICTLIYDYKEVDSAGPMENVPVNIKSGGGSKGTPVSSRSRQPKPSRSEGSQKPTRQSRNTNRDVSRNRSTSEKKLSSQKSYVIEKSADEDCSLTQLPSGIQSLNYFFGKCENEETEKTSDTKQNKNLKPVNCNCKCLIKCCDDIADVDGMSTDILSQNSSATSIITQIFNPQQKIQLNKPGRSNYDKKGMSLPTRSDEGLPKDEGLKTKSLKKSKSLHDVSTSRDDKSSKNSKKRSQSHEPQRSEGMQQSGKSNKNEFFDQGFNTEAVRARNRFMLTSCQPQIFSRRCMSNCCPGEVFKLPPPRSEGYETLGEALSAKERFCNSTCQPSLGYEVNGTVCCNTTDPCQNQICDDEQPSCSYPVMMNDPCPIQNVSTYCPPEANHMVKCARVMWMAPSINSCCPEPKAPSCFCCRENNSLDYCNSDDKLVAVCPKPSKRKKHNQTECFCDHDIDGRFNISNSAIVPPQCQPNNCICYQEEIVCGANDNSACGSYPQARPLICSDTSAEDFREVLCSRKCCTYSNEQECMFNLQGEIIQIHVGQAGVQIANACWELYCIEHGINANGCLCQIPEDDSYKTFFALSQSLKVVPRLVIVDSEPTVIDEIRTGWYGNLFHPDSLINGKEDCGSNFARGYYTIGVELIDFIMDRIRRIAEVCDNLRGFLMFRAIGGGTGSGLGNLIFEQFQMDYGKMPKLEFIVFPSPSMAPLIVESYNALLSTHMGMDVSDCSFIMDNEASYDICSQKLDVKSPTYTNLNRIIAQIVSSFTVSQRFSESSNLTLGEFQTNLVPYPRIHFPLTSFAPLTSLNKSCFDQITTQNLTLQCFQPSNHLVRCNPAEGKYMACVLLYRGDISQGDINSSINTLKAGNSSHFVDWSPSGFKISTNWMPPSFVEGGDLAATNRAVLALTNNTAIEKAWCRLMIKFNKLFSRRAFLHHFLSEGMEEYSLKEASENVCSLIKDYQEVNK